MSLHIPTLMAALLAGYLILTLQLGVAQKGVRARPELRRWTWGSWALLLGFALLAARVVMPVDVSVVLGNGMICLGLAFYFQAVYQLLRGLTPPRWALWLQVPVVLVLLGMLPMPPNLRSVVATSLFVLLLVPSAWLLLQHGWRAERALRTVAVTFLVTIAGLLLRIAHALTQPDQYTALFQPSLGQGMTFLVSFMALLGAGFGFVLAVFERVADQMEQMASHDGLTGCLNRTTTDALLAHAMARGQRERAPVAFVLLDLDHFKQVNDQHGHHAGDEVLRRFAAVVRERLRSGDAVGRTGGEEFGLVLPATDAEGARRLVEEVRLATEALQLQDDQARPVSVTVSAGVAIAHADEGISADRLYGRADQALYEAKHNGRNRVELFGDSRLRQASLQLTG